MTGTRVCNEHTYFTAYFHPALPSTRSLSFAYLGDRFVGASSSTDSGTTRCDFATQYGTYPACHAPWVPIDPEDEP